QAGALPYLTDYLKSNNVVIVHFIRKNLLDIIISKETAFLRNLYHTRNESDIKQISLTLGTSDLIQRLRWQQREVEIAREKYRQIGLPYLEMFYEDLIASQANFDNLFITLDVNETNYELTSSLKKINTASQHEIIKNYDDVAQLLNLAGFGELLRE
ncbi:MAG: hypothetical protein KAR20_00770, partial [Candidatus Heimdallarchaeota archaeon]|nr:hypothetical protein [Candidatus Heimdallarchaeota archaeon]